MKRRGDSVSVLGLPSQVTRTKCHWMLKAGFLQARLLWDASTKVYNIQIDKVLAKFGGPAVPVRMSPHPLRRLPKDVEAVLTCWRGLRYIIKPEKLSQEQINTITI